MISRLSQDVFQPRMASGANAGRPKCNGAAPSEIYTQITEKVESATASVEGVDVISSEATEGSSFSRVQFDIGEDINVAVNEVKAAIDQIRGDLPEGILEPRVFNVATSSNDIVNFAVTADDKGVVVQPDGRSQP